MNHIEAMKQALEAFEDLKKNHGIVYVNEMVDLRQAIAEAEKQEPVPRVVLREGSPTLLSDKAILPTDQRLYTQPDPDALHAAYMSGFHDGKKAQPKAEKQEPVGEIYGWHGKDRKSTRLNSSH